jgi:peptidoglycan/LPS O-acetylase OafA/YrhL
MRDRGYHPGLDGVRGVAILLVLGQHAPTRPLIDGFVGVTVFFCLSGYLITTLLVRELQTATIDLRAFYRRRAARLGPALVAVVAATIVVLLIGRHDLSLGQVFAPAGAAVTYTTSLFDWTHHSFATNDYFNYTWSLSVEEQFYLLLPIALLWVYRRNPRLFAALIASLIGITLTVDLYLGLSQEVKYDPHEYFGSDTNALPILAGSLLALVVHNHWLSRTVRYLAPCALTAAVLLPVVAYRNDTYRTSLVIVAGTGLTLVTLIGVVTRPRSVVGSLLASGPMRWLGERSYSIYLWNVLARIAILNVLGHTAIGDLAWITMFVVLAEASFRFVERPLRAKFSRKSGVSSPPIASPVGTRGPRVFSPVVAVRMLLERYSPEPIVAKLRVADRLHGQARASRGVQDAGDLGADALPLSSQQVRSP